MDLTFPNILAIQLGGNFKVYNIGLEVGICRILQGVTNFGPSHAF